MRDSARKYGNKQGRNAGGHWEMEVGEEEIGRPAEQKAQKQAEKKNTDFFQHAG